MAKILISVIMMLSMMVPQERAIPVDNLYPITGIVTEINRHEDTVTFVDCAGNAWSFYGAEDWCEGDIASCIMYDNGTELIYDDEIIRVHYAGAIEGNAFWVSDH